MEKTTDSHIWTNLQQESSRIYKAKETSPRDDSSVMMATDEADGQGE